MLTPPRSNPDLHKPFSPFASAPSPQLCAAIQRIHFYPRISVGGSYPLPYPGLRVHTMSEPLGFPLTNSQACELLRPATVCKPTPGAGIHFNAMHGCWQVSDSFLKVSNPQWKLSIESLVATIAADLSLPPHLVSASLHGLAVTSHGSTFEAHMPRDTDRVFGTLSVQLPSSYQGGQHTITHGTESDCYPSGSQDGSCAFSYYFTAFYNDVDHEITPITNGFRTTLLYDLQWNGNVDVPSASSRGLGPIAMELTKHAKTFHLEAWSLIWTLDAQAYSTPDLESSGVGALIGTDRQEFNAIKQAAVHAGLGELHAVICSLRKTEHEDHYGENSYEEEDIRKTELVTIDNVYGTTDDWIKDQLERADWDCAELSADNFFEEINMEGEVGEQASRGLVLVFWPEQEDLTLRSLLAENVDDILDESSRSALIASMDLLLTCKKALGVQDRRAWRHTKRLTEVAVKHRLAVQIIRAVNFATMLPEIPDANTVLCQAISAIDKQIGQEVIESFFCLKEASSNHDDGDHIRLLDELLARDVISPECGVRALGNLVENLNRRKTLKAKRRSKNGDPWFASVLAQAYDQPRIKSWSTLFRTFARLHTIYYRNESEAKHLEEIRKRMADVLKQLNVADLNTVTEAIETSRDIAESAFIGPYVRLAVSHRRSELLINRFVRETDDLLSGLEHPSAWYSKCAWFEFLRLLVNTMSSHSTNETVHKKYLEFLGALPALASSRALNSLVTAAILLNEEMAFRSQVLVEVKQAAIIARFSHTEKVLRTRMKKLQEDTCEKPPNVPGRYPGPFGTGFRRIEEFMASDRLYLSYRLDTACSAHAKQVLQNIMTKLPDRTAAESRTHGRSVFVTLQKPGAQGRRRWLKYQADLKQLEKIEKLHADALAQLKQQESIGSYRNAAKRPRFCTNED